MNILNFVDSFSFKQILSVAILLALLFAIPTTVWLVSQQTKLYSAAHKSKLPPGYFVEEQPIGQPSAYPPEISQVKPFLGKVDDVVLILGKNFGENPQQKAIYFGGVKAHEQDLLRWHDGLIEVMVPEGAVSGLIKVVEVDKEDIYPHPFTVYNPNTKTKVFWRGNNLLVQDGFEVAKVKAILAGGQTIEKEIKDHQMQTVLLENVPRNSLLNLTLYNQTGQIIPFFVNPADFGF